MWLGTRNVIFFSMWIFFGRAFLLAPNVPLEDLWPMLTLHPIPIHFRSSSPKTQNDSRRTRTTSHEIRWTKTERRINNKTKRQIGDSQLSPASEQASEHNATPVGTGGVPLQSSADAADPLRHSRAFIRELDLSHLLEAPSAAQAEVIRNTSDRNCDYLPMDNIHYTE